MRWVLDRVNIYTIMVAILIAGGLLFLVLLLVYFMPPPVQPVQSQALTVIPGPTPSPTLPVLTPTPTATQPVSVGGVSSGTFVKISGTEGAGLRLREGPGTGNAMRFIAMDEELFQVKDGPREGDGYVWWYLEAPYDPNRSGWAAANYLTIVQETEPTPAE